MELELELDKPGRWQGSHRGRAHGPPLLPLRGSASVIAPQARFSSPEPRLTRGGAGVRAGGAEQQAAPQGRGGRERGRGERRGTGRRKGRRTQTFFFKEASAKTASAGPHGRPQPHGQDAAPAAAAAEGPQARGGTARSRRAAAAKKYGAVATATGSGSGPQPAMPVQGREMQQQHPHQPVGPASPVRRWESQRRAPTPHGKR